MPSLTTDDKVNMLIDVDDNSTSTYTVIFSSIQLLISL